MAVNALGLPLLFQTGPGQISDLFSGLQSGDTLRGRVIELVGQDQAVVSIKGQNLVAQLPANSGLQKGDALLLQVSKFNPADLAKGASLTLRLLPDPETEPAPAAAPNASQNLSGTGTPIRSELILNAAQLPPSAINLKVAETLAQLGAPLDRASIQNAAQATVALLGNEAQAPKTGSAPSLLQDPSIQAGLQQGLSQLQVEAQFNPSSQNVLILQQAVRAVGLALDQNSAAVGPAGAPAATVPSATPSSAAAVPTLNLAQAQRQVSQTLAAVAADPSPQNLFNLQALLGRLGAAQETVAAAAAIASPDMADLDTAGQPGAPKAQESATAVPGEATTPGSAFQGEATISGGASPVGRATGFPVAMEDSNGLAPAATMTYTGNAALPSQREVLVQFLSGLPADAPIKVSDARTALQNLASTLSDPGSASSQRLLAAVQAQQPGTESKMVLQSARQALQLAGDALAQNPADGVLSGENAVKALFQTAGLPVPQAHLSGLGSEQVAEAVAWLQARNLPPQRPLVETVATWISQDRNALPAAGRALDQAAQIPASVMDAKPSLQDALDAAQQAWQQAGLSPEHPELASSLREWSQTQGLNLEAGLLSGTPSVKPGEAAPAQVNGATGLRPALVRLENELKAAIRENVGLSPADSQRLGTALKETQLAVQALNAVPLQAQSPPAFDTVHLPLPVWMNGQIAGGQLSVTWRKGRERELDDKEPVNVAVALNTESLGTVKVLLQVWKGSASARVLGADADATAFLAKGAAELREGFAERTPFHLQNLEFAVSATLGRRDPAAPDAPSTGGLNVSA
jgi:hypothetical protein